MTHPHILAIDDEKNILEAFVLFLRDEGYKVDPFFQPEKALEAAQKTYYDLAILDVVMKGMDGFTLARKIWEQPKNSHLPVLFVSARVEHADLMIKNFQERVGFLKKPFKKKPLLQKIKEMMGENKSDA